MAAVYYERGKSYSRQRDTQRAKAEYDQAIRLDPKHLGARENRGYILLAQGDAKGALEDFDEAVRLKNDAVSAYWGRGQAYEAQKSRSLALADYKRATELKASTADDIEAQNNARARAAALKSSVPAAPLPLPSEASIAAKAQVESPGGRRVALVIGNAAYTSVDPLTNPKNDAAAVAEELRHLGFEVIEKHDLGVAGMRRALADFENKAAGSDWALVYYAGHGMELSGQNWLVPTDAVLERSTDVPDETIPLDRVLDRVHGAKKLRIVILDACRNNPFLSHMIVTGGRSRSVSRGLAAIEPEHGEVVFFAARDGNVAGDGESDHSPFAAAS